MSHKDWRGGGELLLKNGTKVGYSYHGIARAGFTLRGALGTLQIFATSFCQI